MYNRHSPNHKTQTSRSGESNFVTVSSASSLRDHPKDDDRDTKAPQQRSIFENRPRRSLAELVEPSSEKVSPQRKTYTHDILESLERPSPPRGTRPTDRSGSSPKEDVRLGGTSRLETAVDVVSSNLDTPEGAEIIAKVALKDLRDMQNSNPERKDFFMLFTTIPSPKSRTIDSLELLRNRDVRNEVANIVLLSSKHIGAVSWEPLNKNWAGVGGTGVCMYVKVR